MELLSQYSSRVGGMARPEVIAVELRFHAISRKKSLPETLLKI